MVFDYQGNRFEVPSRRHDGDHSQYYHLMEKDFRDTGALKDGKLGNAKTLILDARMAGDIVYDLLRHNPYFFTEEFQKNQK